MFFLSVRLANSRRIARPSRLQGDGKLRFLLSDAGAAGFLLISQLNLLEMGRFPA
jgi:hypothetical protein